MMGKLQQVEILGIGCHEWEEVINERLDPFQFLDDGKFVFHPGLGFIAACCGYKFRGGGGCSAKEQFEQHLKIEHEMTQTQIDEFDLEAYESF